MDSDLFSNLFVGLCATIPKSFLVCDLFNIYVSVLCLIKYPKFDKIFCADQPHNPMINAGALVVCSMIRPELPLAERFDYVSILVIYGRVFKLFSIVS